jgi:Nuclease-related domain
LANFFQPDRDPAAARFTRPRCDGSDPAAPGWDSCAVRIVELSDHPGDMLKDAHRQRMAEQERAMDRYQKALAANRGRVERAREQRDRARAARRWLSWLRLALAVRRERRAAPSPPVAGARPTDREEIFKVGSDAERAAATELGRVLDDRWTLFAGYRNSRGEIDQLLLGPGGLTAIEVKYRNATVHCRGDDWWYKKFDRYDNMVERGPIEDGRGRSPSRQLNEPADALQRFLGSHGQQVAIGRVLVFTHPRSRVGTCHNPTVRVGTDVTAVARWLGAPSVAQTLTVEQIAAIGQLIVRDHANHNKPRASQPGATRTKPHPGQPTAKRTKRRPGR